VQSLKRRAFIREVVDVVRVHSEDVGFSWSTEIAEVLHVQLFEIKPRKAELLMPAMVFGLAFLLSSSVFGF
jgi:hypothetical protein